MPFIELDAFEFMVAHTNCHHLPKYRVLTLGYVEALPYWEHNVDTPVNLVLPLDEDVLTVNKEHYVICELVVF